MAAHSKLGASGAHRWLNCPGSVNLIGARHGTDDGSEFSARGNAAHDVAALCLADQIEPWEALGREYLVGPHHIVIDGEDLEAIQVYVGFCQDIMARSSFSWVEEPVNLATYHVDLWGTMDFAALSRDETVLDCVDYKHGVGVVVDILDNEQLMQYAGGCLLSVIAAFRDPSLIKTVRLTIVQPRAQVADIRTWETTPKAILAWVEDTLAPGAMATEDPDAPLVAGPWCHSHFCKARDFCPALGHMADDLAEEVSGVLDTAPKEFDSERIGRLLNIYDMVKPFFEGLGDEAFERACRGTKVPGRKLVNGKTNRVWKEGAEEAASEMSALSNPFTTSKLKSPAQMEKEVDGKPFATLWGYQPTGNIVLAREDSKSKEIVRSAIDAFKGIEE